MGIVYEFYCTYCRNKYAVGLRFCPHCGWANERHPDNQRPDWGIWLLVGLLTFATLGWLLVLALEASR